MGWVGGEDCAVRAQGRGQHVISGWVWWRNVGRRAGMGWVSEEDCVVCAARPPSGFCTNTHAPLNPQSLPHRRLRVWVRWCRETSGWAMQSRQRRQACPRPAGGQGMGQHVHGVHAVHAVLHALHSRYGSYEHAGYTWVQVCLPGQGCSAACSIKMDSNTCHAHTHHPASRLIVSRMGAHVFGMHAERWCALWPCTTSMTRTRRRPSRVMLRSTCGATPPAWR